MIQIGKITKITLGRGGYQDVCFGVNIQLGGDSWGSGDFKGTWGKCMADGKDKEWIEGQRRIKKNEV